MKLHIDPDWLRDMALREDGGCVSVGGLVSRIGNLAQPVDGGRSVRTFRISLWDHDPPLPPGEVDSPGRDGRFCLDLAADHLEGPSTGLTPYQLNRALRKLREQWADERILVEAEHP